MSPETKRRRAVHLPEAVLGGDVALGDDEVVERGGADVGDAVGVALDGDGSGEAGDGEGAVELREGVAHGSLGPVAGGEEGDDDADDHEGDGDQKYSEEDVRARRMRRQARRGRCGGRAGPDVEVRRSWWFMVLILSLNVEG